MIFESPLTVAGHRKWLRQNMEYPLSFFTERFAGFAIGPVFYVIHHMEYQYDRRVSMPKNAALGIMRSTDNGCRLHFLTFRGLLCPSQFLLLYLVSMFLCMFKAVQYQEGLSYLPWIMLGILFIVAGCSAFAESCTERSEEGHFTLLQLLSGP